MNLRSANDRCGDMSPGTMQSPALLNTPCSGSSSSEASPSWELENAREHWLYLAREQDRLAEWDANARPAAKHRAESYRRVARALEIEGQTGVPVCSCCFKPFGSGMR